MGIVAEQPAIATGCKILAAERVQGVGNDHILDVIERLQEFKKLGDHHRGGDLLIGFARLPDIAHIELGPGRQQRFKKLVPVIRPGRTIAGA